MSTTGEFAAIAAAAGFDQLDVVTPDQLNARFCDGQAERDPIRGGSSSGGQRSDPTLTAGQSAGVLRATEG